MKPFLPFKRHQALTLALLGALSINATWKFSNNQSFDFASTSAELERTVVTADGAFKAKYYVIGKRTTVVLEASDGSTTCTKCNTYDLDGVVLDKANEKSINDVNVALMKQIEAAKTKTEPVKVVAQTKKEEPKKEESFLRSDDKVLSECKSKKGDNFTLCAVDVVTHLSSKDQDDRDAKSEIDQLYKKHVRKGLMKMIADKDSEERAKEGYDTAKTMIEDLYPSNAKAVIEDLTSVVSKGMTAHAANMTNKLVMSKQLQRIDPAQANLLLNEFVYDRNVFTNQINSVQRDLLDALTSHNEDGFSNSAARNLLYKNYVTPMARVREILMGSNPEQLSRTVGLDSDMGSDILLDSRHSYAQERTVRNLRDQNGRITGGSSIRDRYDLYGASPLDSGIRRDQQYFDRSYDRPVINRGTLNQGPSYNQPIRRNTNLGNGTRGRF